MGSGIGPDICLSSGLPVHALYESYRNTYEPGSSVTTELAFWIRLVFVPTSPRMTVNREFVPERLMSSSLLSQFGVQPGVFDRPGFGGRSVTNAQFTPGLSSPIDVTA